MLFASLVALSLSPLLAVVPADDPASLLPADTLVYFGSTSVHAGWEASKNTAMVRILSEPEVRSFLHQPLAAANSVVVSGFDMMSGEISEAQAAAAELGVEREVDVGNFEISFESAEPPIGKVFFALTHVLLPGMDGNAMPDVGLVLGVEFFDDGMVSQLKDMWELIPGDGSRATHAGVEYLSKLIPETPR